MTTDPMPKPQRRKRKFAKVKNGKKVPSVRTRLGDTPAAAAIRRKAFVEAFMSNGHNAAGAALAAGSRAKNLTDAGHDMMRDRHVQAMIAGRAKVVADLAEMNTERWARELRSLAFSRVGDLVGEDGECLPVAALPPHVQAAIASVEVAPDGTTKYKLWSKPAALETMARHLGLFEKDNAQTRPDVRVNVVLVG